MSSANFEFSQTDSRPGFTRGESNEFLRVDSFKRTGTNDSISFLKYVISDNNSRRQTVQSNANQHSQSLMPAIPTSTSQDAQTR